MGQLNRYKKASWKQYYADLYSECNPVDNTVLDELPASRPNKHMEDILGEVEAT